MLSGQRKFKRACDAEVTCVAACLRCPLTSEWPACCVIPVLYIIDKIVYFPTRKVPTSTSCSEVDETLESGWSWLIFSRVWHQLKWYWKVIPWAVDLKIFQASALSIGGWTVSHELGLLRKIRTLLKIIKCPPSMLSWKVLGWFASIAWTVNLICYFVESVVVPKRSQEATEMVQQAKSPATMPDNLSSNKTRGGRRKMDSHSCPHATTQWHMHTYEHKPKETRAKQTSNK